MRSPSKFGKVSEFGYSQPSQETLRKQHYFWGKVRFGLVTRKTGNANIRPYNYSTGWHSSCVPLPPWSPFVTSSEPPTIYFGNSGRVRGLGESDVKFQQSTI